MVRHAILLLIGAAACGGPAPAPAARATTDSTIQSTRPAPASVMGEIVGVNVVWGDCYARGDAARITALYADDAVVMTTGGQDLVGREAIGKHFEQFFASRPDSVLATNSSTETLDVAGDRAYEAGTVIITLQARRAGARPRRQVVRYITFWQKGPDGSWRIRRSLRPS